MRLSAEIHCRGDRIDYTYDTNADTHSAWFSKGGKSVRNLSAGELVNHLIPYREDSLHVRELIKWLMR